MKKRIIKTILYFILFVVISAIVAFAFGGVGLAVLLAIGFAGFSGAMF